MSNEQYPARLPKFMEGWEGVAHCSLKGEEAMIA